MSELKHTGLKKIPKYFKGFLLLGLIVVYIILFPFLKSEEKAVTEIYYADRISAGHQLIIDKFNKQYEGKIKVIPIDFPNMSFSTNERKELLPRSLRGLGDGIDLLAVDVVWVQRFAKWCEPLGKYFSQKEKERFIQPALKSCYDEGNLVALPFDLVEGVMYYREDLINQQKNSDDILKKIKNNFTWEDFIKIKGEMNISNPFYIFPADNFEGLICSFIELVLSLNKTFFDQNNFNLNKEEPRRALQLLVDLVQKYNLTPKAVTDLTDISSYRYFLENDGIFMRGWPTYDKDFINTSLQSDKAKYLKEDSITSL